MTTQPPPTATKEPRKPDLTALLPFHTPRLILRAATPADAENTLARALDPECVRYLPHLNHQNHTLERINSWINTMDAARRECTALWVIVERKADGAVIGDGGLDQLFWQDDAMVHHKEWREGLTRVGEGGLMLASGADVRGKGYAAEAFVGAMSLGFEGGEDGRGMGCDMIRTQSMRENAQWIGLGRKLGLREIETMSEGKEETCFELTREEYEEGRRKGKWNPNESRA